MNAQPNLKVIYTEAVNQQSFNTNELVATDNIENKCNELIDLKRQIASLDKVKESLEKDIKDYMEDTEELHNRLGYTIATWKVSITKSLDQKKLKESGINLDSFYVEKQKRIFLIK